MAESPPEMRDALREHGARRRRSFQEIRRRQARGLAVLGGLLILLVLAPWWGPRLPLLVFAGAMGLLLLAVALDVVVLNLDWRCPQCGKSLGGLPAGWFWAASPRRCGHCGFRLE